MTIQPTGDNVLIKRKDPIEKTEGGLYVPKTAQEKSNQAIVVAIGPGKVTDKGTTIPMKLEVGMTVLIGKWSGTEIELDGESHLILHQDEILATVVED